ncbi:hypothetical protein WA538_003112, partial [Blastocystis sp. DL]
MAQLAQLFPSQTHPALANHLLAALTAIATQEGGSHTLDSLIDSLVTNSLQKWTRVNREEAIQILSPESRESAARKLLDSYVALANLFCFRDISRQLQDSRVFEAAEVLRNDLLSLPESGVFLQLQFQCLRLQQLKLLYRFAAAGETPDDALGVSLQLFLETAGEALSRAMSRGDDAIFPLEQLLCDALIPAGDRFITEDLTRLLGDALRVQLLGSHDLSVKDEEGELRREERTRHVLEPFRRCCVAHAGSLLPAALLFFCCDY